MMVRAVLQDLGYEIFEAANGLQCMEFLEKNHADVVLLDIKMPGLDGMQVLERIKRGRKDVQVVMLTAFGSVGSAVEAMKKGAFDYLIKPADIDELKAVIQQAYEYRRLVKSERPIKGLSPFKDDAGIIGESSAMGQLLDMVDQVGRSEANVLILGESGTGKELVAQALHRVSPRRKNPLISINSSALPADLLESELFGYQKGAFTGAFKDKPGKFQLAEKGTLFLDEIADFPLKLQPKLLRALQEKKIQPLGDTREIIVDVRFLAATNKDLLHEVRAENFRQDLYYRLNVVEIRVPALRERMEDLPLLVNHFIRVLGKKNRKQVKGISRNFLDALYGYSWPGNIRELENVIERAIILSRSDVLDSAVLPEIIVTESGRKSQAHLRQSSQEALEDAEKKVLKEVLNTHQGHRENTAKALGISRRTLQYKLKKHGLTRRS